MSWLICGAISAMLIVFSVLASVDKEKSSLRILTVLANLFAATFVIYIPLYLDSYGLITGLLGNLIHVLRVITVDADFVEHHALISQALNHPVFVGIYTFLRGILHLALPTVSALTAVTVLLRCFSSLRLMFINRSRRPVYIFSAYNARSLQLARSIEATACNIIFADSTKESISSYNEDNRHFVFKEEKISELKIRPKDQKEIHCFCLSDDEDDSLSCALKLIERFSAHTVEEQEHIHIYLFSQSEDYSVYIDSADKGSLDVQCINEYERYVYQLLDQYPLYRYSKSYIHVLLYGLSPLNAIALRTIAWCGQLKGYDLKISVVGLNIAGQIDALRMTAPGLFGERYSIDFYDCATESEAVKVISEKCGDATYIIVDGANDNRTMKMGVELRRLFYRLDPDFRNCPPLFCFIRDNAKRNITRNLTTAESNAKRKMSYDLTPFGSISELYTYSQLVDSDIEKLAKNVHLAYEEIFSDGEIDVKGALKRYNTFEVNKRSNRANALHIRYKLNLLGLDYGRSEGRTELRVEELCTKDELRMLSIAEHNRWMAFLESEGWIMSARDEVLSYRNSGISKGRHNCPILKMHPYICEYELLKDLSLELEGKDTTVYDEELIVRIPDILGDKWKVAGINFEIIKLREITGGQGYEQ